MDESESQKIEKLQRKKQGGLWYILRYLLNFKEQVNDSQFDQQESSDLDKEEDKIQQHKQEQETKIKEEIKNRWQIIDRVPSEAAESSESGSENEIQKVEENQEDIALLKAKLESLNLELEKSYCQKAIVEFENNRMRQEIEDWLNNPQKKKHKYARIHGMLAFDEVCDQIKMERQSNLKKQENDSE